MARFSKYFTIDNENKTFIFGPRFYQDLFVDGSPVNKAYKAAMALGCYNDYKPVMRPMNINPNRNTATQHFTVDGVETWLKDNNPDWLRKWRVSGEVKTADNKKYSFMVRKSYFLHENPKARVYCGMPDNPEYTLKASATALKSAVEARIERENKEEQEKKKEAKP